MSKVYIKICKLCNKEFETTRSHTSCCSRLCYRRRPEIAERYRDRVSAYQKQHAKDPKCKYGKLVQKCKTEKRKLDLSFNDCVILWNLGCIYCGNSVEKETGANLDRLDNGGGYTKNNVVPCCGNCNKIRNNILTHEEMKIAMTAVLNYRKSCV